MEAEGSEVAAQENHRDGGPLEAHAAQGEPKETVSAAAPGQAHLESLFKKTLFQESKKQAGLLLEELEKVVTASGVDSVLLCRRRRQLKRALRRLVADTALKKMPAAH